MQSPCLSVAMQTLCCGVVDFDRPKTVRFLDVAPMEFVGLRDKRTPEDILRMSAGVQNCRTGVNISGRGGPLMARCASTMQPKC